MAAHSGVLAWRISGTGKPGGLLSMGSQRVGHDGATFRSIRLQQYVNQELPDVQAGFRKSRGTRDQILNVCWITEKGKEIPEKHLLLLH